MGAALLKMFAAPYAKSLLALAGGLAVTETLWAVGPFLRDAFLYALWTLGAWAWAKAIQFKGKLLGALNWLVFVAVVMFVTTFVAFPFLDRNPDYVDLVLDGTGTALVTGWGYAATASATLKEKWTTSGYEQLLLTFVQSPPPPPPTEAPLVPDPVPVTQVARRERRVL